MKVDRLWKDILSACFFCILQAIPHCRFGQVLLGGFGGLKHGAYVCYVFLKSTGFATKLALMFLEAFFHRYIAGGAGNCRRWSGQLLQRES